MIIDYRFLDSYQLLGKEGSERSIRLISSTRNTRNTNIYSNYCEISGDGKRNDGMVPSVFRIFLCILCGLSKSVLSRARCQDQNISSIVVYSPLSQLTSLRPVSGIVSTAQPSSRMEEVANLSQQRLSCRSRRAPSDFLRGRPQGRQWQPLNIVK